jgi:Winged helix DNA-binding domain
VSEARRRARAQLLHRPAGGTPATVARHLLAVQAQDARAAPLAFRARIAGLTAGDVDAAFARGELVTTWLLRTTLHTVHADDLPWLHALFAPRATAANRRRLGQEGVSEETAEGAVAFLSAALAEEGPLPRAALGERLAGAGVPTTGQALPHLLHRGAIAGVLVLGPGRAFAPAHALLGGPPPDHEAALAELGRRFRAAHPDGTDADLARWTGLPRGETRRALRDAPAGGEAESGHVPLRLLPPFDELLLGWADRGPVVPAAHARRVHPGGGVLRAVVTDDGAAVGTWGATDVTPFPGATLDARALAAEKADVARFREPSPSLA